MSVEELTRTALVGVGRTPMALPPMPDEALGATLEATATETAEDRLLTAAAVLLNYEACGSLPAKPSSCAVPMFVKIPKVGRMTDSRFSISPGLDIPASKIPT